MAGFQTTTNQFLIEDEVWSKQLKQLLLDDLFATKFVRIIGDFPTGNLINIPSIGEAEVQDFSEGAAVKYQKLDEGNFTFSYDQYKYSAHSVSEKFKRDSMYAQEVISAFPTRQHRAIMEGVEARIFNRAYAGQTVTDTNTINDADHRWWGSGTSTRIALQDFAKAHYALSKANVPMTNLVAVVDPSVAYTLQTQTNLMNLLSPVPMWENITREGIVTGFKFRFNIFGFDVYVSNYLPRTSTVVTDGTIDGVAASGTPVCNFFFSAQSGDVCPIIGGFRQMPTVYSEFNKDKQETEYLTITEYGFKLYRPENMVTVLTNYDVV